jgi:hypothetical protein
MDVCPGGSDPTRSVDGVFLIDRVREKSAAVLLQPFGRIGISSATDSLGQWTYSVNFGVDYNSANVPFHIHARPLDFTCYLESISLSGAAMVTERADTVAIMAAIIYAGRTGESGQAPNEKVFGVIARAAWELHKAVVRGDEVQVSRG